MTSRIVTSVAAGAIAVMASLSLQAQAPASTPGEDAVKAFIASRVTKNWTPPKTPWGDPDIQGIFTTKDEANTPLERPDEWAGKRMDDITPKEFAAALAERQQRAVERAPFAGGGEEELGVAIAVPIHWFDNLAAKNSRPWFVIDPPEGKIPARVDGRTGGQRGRGAGPNDGAFRLTGGRRDSYTDRSLGDRCIAHGLFRMPTIYGNSYQIVQSRDYVVIRQEQIHEARVIPLDGRAHANANIKNYMGDSRGRWDGNTLVIETVNQHESQNYQGAPVKGLRLIQRFTRISPTQVEMTMTVENPSAWQRPWTFSIPLTEDNTQPIHEYACHEGNFGLANILTSGRQIDDKRPATAR